LELKERITIMKTFSTILLLFSLASLFANPTSNEINLTLGNKHKWQVYNFKKVVWSKVDGFVGITKNSGRLVSQSMNILANKSDIIEVVTSKKWNSSKLYFHSLGGKFTESNMVRGINEENLTIFDLSKTPHWKGKVTALRFDINNTKEVIIRAIRFRKSTNVTSLKSPFLSPINIKQNQSVTLQREPIFPVPVFFNGTTNNPIKISCVQFNILGKKLTEEHLTFSNKKFAGQFKYIANSALIKLVVSNPNKTNTTFSLDLYQQNPKKVTPKAKTYSVNIANVPTQTNENTIWQPQVFFTKQVPTNQRFRLRLIGNNKLNIIIADQLVKNSKKISLPKVFFSHLTNGKYQLVAEVENTPCQINPVTITHLRKTATTLPTVKIDFSQNRPTYIINNKEKVETMEYLLSDPPPSSEAIQQAINAYNYGIKGIRLRLIFRFDKNNQVTFEEIDSAILSILSRCPDANLMLHVSVTDPGPSFRSRYPEEGIKDEHGNFKIKNYRDKAEATSSMASKRWINDSEKMLDTLIKHLNQTPLGEKVIGILPCAGITWEWLNWGSARGVMVDYSQHSIDYFISYLKKIYHNDITKLNKAWKRSLKSFDEVTIPVPQRRKTSDTTEYRTLFNYKQEIDYADSVSSLIATNVERLCKVVKKSSNNRLLAGSYYGYTTYLSSAFRCHNAGHHNLTQLLNSPYVDILSGPTRYAGRHLGGGSGFMYPAGSINLHKKLIISECDDRPINASNGNGRSRTVIASRSAFERALAIQLAGNSVMRWFDFSKGWVMDEPRMLDLVKALSYYDKALIKLNPQSFSPSDVAAIITSEKSAATLNPNTNMLHMLLENTYQNIVNSGVAFSMFNVEDLTLATKNRKFIVLLNLFRLNPKEKAAIENLFKQKNKIIFVTSGIGVFDQSGKYSKAFAEKLFQSKFTCSNERKEHVLTTTQAGKDLLNIPSGQKFSLPRPCGNILYPEGKDWIVLGKSLDGKIALAAKKLNSNLIIWSSYPIIWQEHFQSLAKYANMPYIKANNSASWFNNGYGFVHSANGTVAEVKLPANFSGICEFPSMKKIKAKNGKITKKVAPKAAWLFSLTK
jgi:hypothetical protein